nr:serine hydrolase [Alkalilimnicola ehrlichii]
MDSSQNLSRPLRLLVIALLFSVFASNAAATAPDWKQRLEQRLIEIDTDYPGELGVYVQDLTTGDAVSFRGEQSWYLASGIKVPVAIEVMRRIEQGEFSLDTTLRLLSSDYVDGAGETNWHPPGTELSVRFLLEQMLVRSDNTATDVLIRQVGLDAVNNAARQLAPEGLGEITTLADVRRHAYSAFHESAFTLQAKDFLALRQANQEQERIALLATILDVEPTDFAVADLRTAFERYYATNLNGGQLTAFSTLLAALAQGQALGADGTAYLMDVLSRIQTAIAASRPAYRNPCVSRIKPAPNTHVPATWAWRQWPPTAGASSSPPALAANSRVPARKQRYAPWAKQSPNPVYSK